MGQLTSTCAPPPEAPRLVRHCTRLRVWWCGWWAQVSAERERERGRRAGTRCPFFRRCVKFCEGKEMFLNLFVFGFLVGRMMWAVVPVSLSLAPCDCRRRTWSASRRHVSAPPHAGLAAARASPVPHSSASNTPLTSKLESTGKCRPSCITAVSSYTVVPTPAAGAATIPARAPDTWYASTTFVRRETFLHRRRTKGQRLLALVVVWRWHFFSRPRNLNVRVGLCTVRKFCNCLLCQNVYPAQKLTSRGEVGKLFGIFHFPPRCHHGDAGARAGRAGAGAGRAREAHVSRAPAEPARNLHAEHLERMQVRGVYTLFSRVSHPLALCPVILTPLPPSLLVHLLLLLLLLPTSSSSSSSFTSSSPSSSAAVDASRRRWRPRAPSSSSARPSSSSRARPGASTPRRAA
jgi:hypothetical protein